MGIFNKFSEITEKVTSGIYFIKSSTNESFLSYRELKVKACKVLTLLLNAGLKKGDELVFQINDEELFLTIFWACIAGGIIPIPLSIGTTDEHRRKTLRIIALLNDPFIISDKKNISDLKKLEENSKDISEKRVLYLENIIDQSKNLDLLEESSPVLCSNDSIAFIQYSSGSTSDPKGVTLTHNNILKNCYANSKAAKVSSSDKVLSWMPLTHDMGLIGMHLMSALRHIDQYLMPTKLFIRNPSLWMEKSSEHKITMLSSPNFGYKFFLKYNRLKRNSCNLESIRLIYNGAEPISYSLIESFSEYLSSYGLRENAMLPVYGLAEGTVAVSFSDPECEPEKLDLDRKFLGIGDVVRESKSDYISCVNCGKSVDSINIRITNGKSEVFEDNKIGYIEIKGECVTSGYYNNPEATKKVLSEDNWLNTGDLGFLRDGKLYVTGRAKDLIFINGQNYYSHDIEKTLVFEGILELGKIAVSSVLNKSSDSEELVVFVAYKKDIKSFLILADRIKEVLYRNLSIAVTKILPVNIVPKTTSGKLQRQKLIDMLQNDYFKEVESVIARELEVKKQSYNLVDNNIEELIIEEISKLTDLGSDILSKHTSFHNLDLDSVLVLKLADVISKKTGREVSPILMYNYPTVHLLADYIKNGSEESIKIEDNRRSGKIAVIGMSCKFPGCENITSFWDLLITGKSAISSASVKRQTLVNKEVPFKAGYLNDIDQFDAELFNISPKEAKLMDPQHRLLLEQSYNALLSANINPESLAGTNTGVFIGISQNDYLKLCMDSDNSSDTYLSTGNALSLAANRLSYFYDLKGPSMAIDTACSSSLVALIQAVQSLEKKECDLAIVGGVNLLLLPSITQALEKSQMLSPDSSCKVFDESANGYVRGEGCGVVILRSVDSSIKNNNPVLACISGTAMEQDGRSNGITAPNGLSQQRVLEKALLNADIRGSNVDLVETHGTGTKLGDPIEVDSIARVYCKNRKNTLYLNSVKANIGHLESAAGIAGFIKTVLCLNYNEIPKQVNYKNPNPIIPWNNFTVTVPNKSIKMSDSNRALRSAGVSSFGFGGMNAHVILENYELKTIFKDPCYDFNRKSYWIDFIKKQDLAQFNTPKYESKVIENIRTGNFKCLLEDLAEFGKTSNITMNDLDNTLKLLFNLHKNDSNFNVQNDLYKIKWKKIDEIEPVSAKQENVLVIFTNDKSSDEFIKNIERSVKVITIHSSEHYYKRSPDKYFVQPGNISHIRNFFRDLEKLSSPKIDILYLWSMGDYSKKNLSLAKIKDFQNETVCSLLSLMKEISAIEKACKLWLVTRRSQQVFSFSDSINIEQSLIWGMAKSYVLEQPDNWGGIIDLENDLNIFNSNLISQIILSSFPERQFAIRDKSIFIPRLNGFNSSVKSSSSFHSEAIYLITGGLGGLGFETVKWMIEIGAKNFVLISRNPPSIKKREEINIIRKQGVSINIFEGDISNHENVKSLFKYIEDLKLKLSGIIHAAGISDFSELMDMTFEKFERVTSAKVYGGFLLHEYSKNEELDFFITYSSITSLWGARGQMHYSAANHFLDQLVRHRLSLGLPGLSINWGPWAQIGMVKDNYSKEFVKRGIKLLDPSEAFDALRLLLGNDGVYSFTDISWNKFAELYEIVTNDSFLSEVTSTESSLLKEVSSTNKLNLKEKILKSTGEDRLEVILNHLNKLIINILGFESNRSLDYNQGFFQMGMDSLMSQELVEFLRVGLNEKIPTTIPFEYNNIQSPGTYIYDLFTEEELNLDHNEPEITEEEALNFIEKELEELI